MAVRDDLDALGMPDERTHLVRAPALEQSLEREIRGARDVSLARIAVCAGMAVELGSRPDVQELEIVVAEAPTELVERHVCH